MLWMCCFMLIVICVVSLYSKLFVMCVMCKIMKEKYNVLSLILMN